MGVIKSNTWKKRKCAIHLLHTCSLDSLSHSNKKTPTLQHSQMSGKGDSGELMFGILVAIIAIYITIAVLLPMVVDHIKFFGKFVLCYILTNLIMQKFGDIQIWTSTSDFFKRFVTDQLNTTMSNYL